MRLCWVDNAKAIGIILVVYGHTAQCGALDKELIYSFHMPLFFFLAGYLVKDSHLRIPLFSFLKNNLKRLIVPYFTFWFLSYLLWLPTRALRTEAFHTSLSLIDPVVGLFYGIEENLYVNHALWFFPCLFMARLVFWWLHNRLNPNALIIATTVAPILGIASHGVLPFRLPWGIDSALVALFFYGQGYNAARAGILEKRRPLRNWAGITMLCFVPWALIANSNGNVAMDQMVFGNSVLLFFMTAAIGIVMAVSAAKLIPRSALGRWLSENTIMIFPYHKLAFNVFTGIGVVFCGLDIGFRDSLFFHFLFTSGALALSYPMVFAIRRYMPWAAGLPSSSVQAIQPLSVSPMHRREYSTIAVGPRKTKPSP